MFQEEIIIKVWKPNSLGENTTPSNSSFIKCVLPIFRRKVDGFNQSEKVIKIITPALKKRFTEKNTQNKCLQL